MLPPKWHSKRPVLPLGRGSLSFLSRLSPGSPDFHRGLHVHSFRMDRQRSAGTHVSGARLFQSGFERLSVDGRQCDPQQGSHRGGDVEV